MTSLATRFPSVAALPYPVHVERGLLNQLGQHVERIAPAHRYALIVDATVAELHGARLCAHFPAQQTTLLTVPPGEQEKTRRQWAMLTDQLLAWGAGRDTTIVAIGGGVVGDLAGFIAATFMRGVPFVQVPTTLLAMVDASVGGKTGVDTSAGKNLVGAFHNPSAVFADPDSLVSLPPAVFRSGLAEMIKHGVLASADYFRDMANALSDLSGERGALTPNLPELIAGSIAIKAAVVADDLREGGKRQVLNLGHTIAHAIEQQVGYEMLHGDAVGIGLVVEADIAERMGVAQTGLADEIRKVVSQAGLPVLVPSSVSAERVIQATHGDKKSRSGHARYALPTAIGTMSLGDGNWSLGVPDEIATAAVLAHQK